MICDESVSRQAIEDALNEFCRKNVGSHNCDQDKQERPRKRLKPKHRCKWRIWKRERNCGADDCRKDQEFAGFAAHAEGAQNARNKGVPRYRNSKTPRRTDFAPVTFR
jgi:hypothetical protein